jgi:hypothetical protein
MEAACFSPGISSGKMRSDTGYSAQRIVFVNAILAASNIQ